MSWSIRRDRSGSMVLKWGHFSTRSSDFSEFLSLLSCFPFLRFHRAIYTGFFARFSSVLLQYVHSFIHCSIWSRKASEVSMHRSVVQKSISFVQKAKSPCHSRKEEKIRSVLFLEQGSKEQTLDFSLEGEIKSGERQSIKFWEKASPCFCTFSVGTLVETS